MLLVACLSAVLAYADGRDINTLTAAEQAAGWQLLFDGESLDGWRRYRGEVPGKGWQVEDGKIVRADRAGDLITDAQFDDFEFRFEWWVEPGGNSGVFYRVTEDHRHIFMSAPEYQVLDDAQHKDGKSPLTSAAAAYALYPTPRGVVKPAEHWNSGRIVVRGQDVEHWLNDEKVVVYTIGSADWQARVADSKFASREGFGTATRGHIGLQDHGDRVAYRNLKIRPLGPGE